MLYPFELRPHTRTILPSHSNAIPTRGFPHCHTQRIPKRCPTMPFEGRFLAILGIPRLGKLLIPLKDVPQRNLGNCCSIHLSYSPHTSSYYGSSTSSERLGFVTNRVRQRATMRPAKAGSLALAEALKLNGWRLRPARFATNPLDPVGVPVQRKNLALAGPRGTRRERLPETACRLLQFADGLPFASDIR